MEQVHLIISGRVQGVFFRHNTQLTAHELGLDGWVRNLPTGEVETVAQGPRDKLEAFLGWCRKGPNGAKVDNVEVSWGEASEKLSGFRITF